MYKDYHLQSARKIQCLENRILETCQKRLVKTYTQTDLDRQMILDLDL